MQYKFLFLLLAFILFPMNSNALMCANKDKVHYQSLAQNITSTYDYVEQNGEVVFNITLSNIPEKFMIHYLATNQKYYYSSSELKLDGFAPGKSYRFDVYIDDNSCFLDRLYSIYVNIPPYNRYYNDPVCDGVSEYKYCQKWQLNKLSYDDFIKNVNNYKKSLEKHYEVSEPNDNESFFEKAIEFYSNYYYIILPSIILIGFIILYRHNRENRLF